MSGYNGYSMSNNAIGAYDDGEMPLSKWNKKNIIERIKEMIEENEVNTILTNKEIETLPLYILKKLLRFSSWHHTSSIYNKTDFYSIDIDELETLTIQKVKTLEKEHKETITKPKEKTSYYYAIVEYSEWIGTQRHPKLETRQSKALIVGNWAYLFNCEYYKRKKKNINGKHFYILEKYGTRKPKSFNKEVAKTIKAMALK